MNEFCQSAWKESFATKAAAVRAAKGKLRAYPCPDCGRWHLTGHAERQLKRLHVQRKAHYA